MDSEIFFAAKKWTLVVLIVVQIIGLIIYASFVHTFADNAVENSDVYPGEQEDALRVSGFVGGFWFQKPGFWRIFS